jgi:diguanylate cyclase (GGDEF)-like protein/PAS domain S-box-containing protein
MPLGHPNQHGVTDAVRALVGALGPPIAIAWRTAPGSRAASLDAGLGEEPRRALLLLLDDADAPTPTASGWRHRTLHADGGAAVAVAVPTETPQNELDALCHMLGTLVSALVDQERFRFVLDNSADVIAIMRRDGTAEYVTPSVERVMGWPVSFFESQSAFGLLHADDEDGVVASVGMALTEPGELYTGRFRVRHAAGHWVWVDGRITIAPGRHDVALFSARDVTAEVESQRLVDAEHRRYRALLDGSPLGIAIHQDRSLVYINRAAASILGADDPSTLLGSPLERFTTADPAVIDERLARARSGVSAGPYEVTVRRVDGATADLEITTIPTTWNGRWAIQTLAIDLSERRRAEAMLEHASLHDPLTGLPNRRLLADRLEGCMSRARRTGGRAALFFCDLDHFKVVNDAIGHSVGDEILVEMGRRLRRATRETDTVARFGGDEFVVLSEELGDDESVAALADRIRVAGQAPFVLEDHTIHLTLSTGVVRITGKEATDEILSSADSAMYAAKRAGRDRWVFFEEGLRARASDRLRIESALRGSLDTGSGLRIHVQPEVDLGSRSVVGYEALVRWDGPDGSGVAPDRFLPVAADAGLMPRIGRFVVDRAVAAITALSRSTSSPWVAMNASVEELEHPDFGRDVALALDRAEVDGSRLCIEITEHSIMRDPAGTASVLRPLRERGVTIAIDDFGTGYSSLAHLARFHPDFVKIDRSFTADMIGQPTQRSIVEAVLHLATSLGITTVAEGVETEAQAQLLTELGCQLGQGWYFGRPASTETFAGAD